MTATQLRQRLRAIERTHDTQVGEARAIARHATETKTRIAELLSTTDTYTAASAVLASYAETAQRDVQSKIEHLVTHGLTSIFGDGLSFHITQTQRGKRSEVDLTIKSSIDGHTIETDVMSARGGGVAAVAGLLLRLTIILLSPNVQRVLVLDETFAQLSEEYEQPLATFLRQLCDQTGTQIILVTHSREYAGFADRTYRLTSIGGATRISEE